MRRGLLLSGWAALWVVAGALGAAGQEEGAGALEGAWRAVSASREGAPAEDLRGHRLTFDEDRFVIRSAGGEVLYRGTVRIDPEADPPTIDFRHEGDPLAGTTWLGIYRLDGETLRICDNAEDPERPRPTGFASEPGSGTVLVRFERATPDGPSP